LGGKRKGYPNISVRTSSCSRANVQIQKCRNISGLPWQMEQSVYLNTVLSVHPDIYSITRGLCRHRGHATTQPTHSATFRSICSQYLVNILVICSYVVNTCAPLNTYLGNASPCFLRILDICGRRRVTLTSEIHPALGRPTKVPKNREMCSGPFKRFIQDVRNLGGPWEYRESLKEDRSCATMVWCKIGLPSDARSAINCHI
jgi:hypothetical protein